MDLWADKAMNAEAEIQEFFAIPENRRKMQLPTAESAHG